jgi:type IV pilus assembly protein PilA
MQNMLANLRARREDDERGFTLIELMVVVLIIAILIAIAIPTFLGAKSRAQDKAAQSSLRNGLTNAKGIYTDLDSYGSGATDAARTTSLIGSTTSGLIAAEPSLTFQTAASTGAKVVSVDVRGTTGLVMTAKAASGNCYAIGDSANGPGTVFAHMGTATCDAASAPALPSTAPTVSNATSGGGWAQAW